MKPCFLVLFLIIARYTIFAQYLPYPASISDNITSITSLSKSELLLSTKDGSIFKSYDGGNTWILKASFGEEVFEIQFLDGINGFAWSLNSVNILYQTTDAGENWQSLSLSLPPFSYGKTLMVLPEKKLILSQYGNISVFDKNKGSWDITYRIPTFNWLGARNTPLTSPYGWITKFLSLNNKNLIAVGNNSNIENTLGHIDFFSYLLLSRNEGNSWDTLWTGLKSYIKDIYYLNDSIGWMITDSLVYKSITGGQTWQPQFQALASSMYIRDNSIYFLALDSTFIMSSDSGKNWTTYSVNFNTKDLKLFFIDSLNGFVYGSKFFHTVDGGKSWNYITQPEGVSSADFQYNFNLFQNYPNPFNPSTTINYQVQKKGLVIIKIYNILGTELESIVNEEKSPGVYTVEFNASNLSSGIYFYRMQSGEFSQTKKLIFMK